MELTQVGAAITARRNILKLSMRAAAERGDIHPSTWADLEKGKHPPTEATQLGVARGVLWPDDWFDLLQEGTHWTAIPKRVNSLDVDATHLLKRLMQEHRKLAQVVVDLAKLSGVDASVLLADDLNPDEVAL